MSPQPILTTPIRFMGATVLGFNATLGVGSAQQSSLTVDLVEDCENGDSFEGGSSKQVGDLVVFQDSQFSYHFGGMLQSWTQNFDSGGNTFKVTLVDPRQLLDNFTVVVDSYMGPPTLATNYYNAYWDLEGNCDVWGTYGSSPDRGFPYNSVIRGLMTRNPVLVSGSNWNYEVQWSDLQLPLPDYYRVNGPGLSVMQMLTEACEAVGYDFYCFIDENDKVRVAYINLKTGATVGNLAQYKGSATAISYGQEAREGKTKALIFGENYHYMTGSNRFCFYFGEEQLPNGSTYPIIPYAYTSSNGFWISVNMRSISKTLYNPFLNGYFTISELDIRAAMAGFETWRARAEDDQIPGSLNAAIRGVWKAYGMDSEGSARNVLERVPNSVNAGDKYQAMIDFMIQPRLGSTGYTNTFQLDLEAIHGFVQNLGNTYYGKQFFCGLPQNICIRPSANFGEMIYTDVPTNAGGWVDYGMPVLGLYDPDLSLFRETDGRIGAFLMFSGAPSSGGGSGDTVSDDDPTNPYGNDYSLGSGGTESPGGGSNSPN